MFIVQTTIIYIPNLSLHNYAPYDGEVYTLICALTLVIIPVTLILTFSPIETPLIQLVVINL